MKKGADIKKVGSFPIYLRRKPVFFLKKPYFESVLWTEDFPYGQVVPCPGKRAFGSPKKAVVPLSPMRASAPCCRAIPFPPRLFAERKKEEKGRFDPGPFCLRRLLFCPGNEKTCVIDLLNWRSSSFF